MGIFKDGLQYGLGITGVAAVAFGLGSMFVPGATTSMFNAMAAGPPKYKALATAFSAMNPFLAIGLAVVALVAARALSDDSPSPKPT